MLRFLHGYMAEDWDGLVLRGLIDETSGVKFHQSQSIPPELGFNEVAREGGRLYGIVRQANRPFYVDRLQGGSAYYRYSYDEALLDRYKEMAGEWFLGFQMHEWASNMLSDWRRITQEMGERPADFSAWAIDRALRRAYPAMGAPFLECASPQEYSSLSRPMSREDLLAQMDAIYTLRQRQTGGFLLPADSYFMAIRQEIGKGTRALMPEIGAQIPLERMQLALTRGMARDAGIRWGTYYEPWGGEPFGCCFYKDTPVNEWSWYGTEDLPFQVYGPTGGSSRLLQKRIYYHSLLSGAQFMSEEWGTSNTFASWSDYSLSAYGQNKRDFLAFAGEHRTLGDVVAPVALVLPTDFAVFDLIYLRGDGDEYLGFSLSAGESRRFSHLRRVLRLLLGDAGHKYGNEGHTIGNSAYGDAFDILYADARDATLARYDVLVDLSVDGALATQRPGFAGRILESRDVGAMEEALQAALARLLPCHVSGELSWILNRDGAGFVLGLFNNEGVYRSVATGDQPMAEADTTAVITAKGRRLEVLLGDASSLHQGDEAWRYDLPAGQVALLRLV
jgi:hypothetical protein